MELRPVPTRPSLMGRLWLVVAGAVIAPIVLLVVLPGALGLQRYVVSSDSLGDSVPRGSLTFAETVPAAELGVGDVITFRPPIGLDGSYVTRRIVSVTDRGIETSGDGTGTDPWVLPATGERSRVIVHVPYIGYPFISGLDPIIWVMLASVPMVAVLLAVMADLERARERRRRARRLEEQSAWGS